MNFNKFTMIKTLEIQTFPKDYQRDPIDENYKSNHKQHPCEEDIQDINFYLNNDPYYIVWIDF